jgi:hypothetical protein
MIYLWKAAWTKAILETDSSKLSVRIMAARAILADRLDSVELIDDEERSEIERALVGLKILETERCS